MPLADLLNVPHTPEELMEWSFAHADAHYKINTAIYRQKGLPLQPYILDPMPTPSEYGDMSQWQYGHQAAHSAFEGVLGIAGTDLSSVDFTKQDQVESWIRLHFQSHYDAQQQLSYTD